MSHDNCNFTSAALQLPIRRKNKHDELPSKLCASTAERSRIESPGPLGHSRTLGEVATGLGWSSSDNTVQRIHPD